MTSSEAELFFGQLSFSLGLVKNGQNHVRLGHIQATFKITNLFLILDG